MSWTPSNETIGYDEQRVDKLTPLQRAVDKLRLPPGRGRKLHTILNALEVQIEDGGDHPEVNRLLLEALAVGTVHQVGEKKARPVRRAIDAFAMAETERWDRLRAGANPVLEVSPENRYETLVIEGYRLLEERKQRAAMDAWLAAWELLKEIATPEMRTTKAFDAAHPGLYQLAFNWTSDLEMELHNAGFQDPTYYRHRLRFADEFLAQFPDEDPWRWQQMLRAKGEALFWLGRPDEGEAVLCDLIARYPDHPWGYIGLSDQYSEGWNVPVDFARAEALLLAALERPELDERNDVLERLASIYYRWGRKDDFERVVSDLPARQRRSLRRILAERFDPQPPAETPGRNDPCWCGSGKKYKRCHWRSDQAQR